MTQSRSPVVYVIGGPNGAGKTTFARSFLPEAGVVEFLNADLLAEGLSPLRPELMAVRSGRLLLTRWKELFLSRKDFAFESTLSGRTYAVLLQRARTAGYKVRLCYLWLPDVGYSIRRVRQRVRKGGHDVPPADLKRRFGPSLSHFFSLYLPLADEALLFNAAGNPPSIISEWKGGRLIVRQTKTYEHIQKQWQEFKIAPSY